MGAGAVEHSRAYSVVKNEDAVELCCLDLPTGEGLKAIGEASQARLFMMCDGHIGNTCSRLISKRFPEVLRHKLPRTEVPSEDDAAFGKYTAAVVRAMAESFVEIDNILLKEDIGRSGSTTTALLVIGNLITVANVGDSDCVLDTGIAWMSLTKSHRIVANPSEEQRLLRAGRTVAKLGFHLQGPALGDERGVGPLRLWPGGLAMARSVGDFDSGSECAPVPHIKQVLLTSKETVRIILASDGLWDAVSTPKAVRAVRNMPVFSAASELVRLAARNPHVIDDTTVLVIDVVPPGAPSFPASARALRDASGYPAVSPPRSPAAGGSGGGFFGCFRGPATKDVQEDETTRHACLGIEKSIKLLCDRDCLTFHPDLSTSFHRSATTSTHRSGASKSSGPPRSDTLLAKSSSLEDSIGSTLGSSYGFSSSGQFSAEHFLAPVDEPGADGPLFPGRFTE